MRMTRGAVLYELNEPLIIEDLRIPELGFGQVLVRIKNSGLCHTQLEEMTGKRGDDPYLPHLLGHEGAGVVEEIGPGVTRVKQGDHVVLGWMKGKGINSETPTYYKGDKAIRAGWIATFNDFAVLSENRVTPMKKEMPFDVASLLGCAVTTGLGAVKRIAGVEPGASVAVFGAGGVGQNVIQWASMALASQVIAVDLRDDKLALASKLGATNLIHAGKEDPVTIIKDLTGGQGADYGFEVTGNIRVMEQAYEATGGNGTTVLVGVPELDDKLCINPIPLYLGKRLTGCRGGETVKDDDIPYCVDLYLKGQLKLDELISDRVELDGINDAFNKMKEGRLVGRAIVEFE